MGADLRGHDVAHGRSAITAGIALRLGKYFGTTPQLWLNLQSDYDLRRARATDWPKIEPRVRVLRRRACVGSARFARPNLPNTSCPTRASARDMGRRGERGADAKALGVVRGSLQARHPRSTLQGGLPGTADEEAVSSLSFFPGVAGDCGAAALQPPARTVGRVDSTPS